MLRANRLYGKAMHYIENVVGPENRYEKEALQRLILIRFEDIPSVEQDIADFLLDMHPRKCEYIGWDSLSALIRVGKIQAESYSAHTTKGVGLFVGLMFIFGRGCFIDPQFPWVASTLNNLSIADPNKKLKDLYSKTMTYMKQALKNIEKR